VCVEGWEGRREGGTRENQERERRGEKREREKERERREQREKYLFYLPRSTASSNSKLISKADKKGFH
jgi:hypothetical protein